MFELKRISLLMGIAAAWLLRDRAMRENYERALTVSRVSKNVRFYKETFFKFNL